MADTITSNHIDKSRRPGPSSKEIYAGAHKEEKIKAKTKSAKEPGAGVIVPSAQ